MMENVAIDRDTMIRVNVPGTSGFYRLRCEAFFTVSKADFKKMMKALQADTETAADNARILSEWAFQNREAVKASGSMERWAAINSIFSDYQERPESAAISSAVSDLEKLNKKMKTGRKVTKEIRGDDIYITNNSIVLKHGNAAVYENHETCIETSNTYERIFSGYENKAFLFSQVLPDTKTLKIQGKTRGAKQTAYYVNAKGTAFNVNYIQYAAAVTDSREIYFNPDGNVCYMAGNGFTVAIAQCAIDFTDCANNIIITKSRNTLAGMEVIYKYPCGDSLPVYRCVMEYFNGDHNTTYHPTRDAALQYAAETMRHYPGIIAGISINSGIIAGRMSWNEDGETFQAANIEAEAAEAKENNISSVPAGKEFSNHETDADIINNVSDAFQEEKTENNAAADPEKLYNMAGLKYTGSEIEKFISDGLYLVKHAAVYAFKRTRRGYSLECVYEVAEACAMVPRGKYTLVHYQTLKNMFPWFPADQYADTVLLTVKPTETVPGNNDSVRQAKTAENRTEGNAGISYKASGKTSVYQPKTGITEDIKTSTVSGYPVSEKMSKCTNCTESNNIEYLHKMNNSENPGIVPYTESAGVQVPDTDTDTFPSALSALEKLSAISEETENPSANPHEVPADDHGYSMESFNKVFCHMYNHLYNAREYHADLVNRFDHELNAFEVGLLKALAEYRQDFITSDREAAAFCMALDRLEYVEKKVPENTPVPLDTVNNVVPSAFNSIPETMNTDTETRVSRMTAKNGKYQPIPSNTVIHSRCPLPSVYTAYTLPYVRNNTFCDIRNGIGPPG